MSLLLPTLFTLDLVSKLYTDFLSQISAKNLTTRKNHGSVLSSEAIVASPQNDFKRNYATPFDPPDKTQEHHIISEDWASKLEIGSQRSDYPGPLSLDHLEPTARFNPYQAPSFESWASKLEFGPPLVNHADHKIGPQSLNQAEESDVRTASKVERTSKDLGLNHSRSTDPTDLELQGLDKIQLDLRTEKDLLEDEDSPYLMSGLDDQSNNSTTLMDMKFKDFYHKLKVSIQIKCQRKICIFKSDNPTNDFDKKYIFFVSTLSTSKFINIVHIFHQKVHKHCAPHF